MLGIPAGPLGRRLGTRSRKYLRDPRTGNRVAKPGCVKNSHPVCFGQTHDGCTRGAP